MTAAAPPVVSLALLVLLLHGYATAMRTFNPEQQVNRVLLEDEMPVPISTGEPDPITGVNGEIPGSSPTEPTPPPIVSSPVPSEPPAREPGVDDEKARIAAEVQDALKDGASTQAYYDAWKAKYPNAPGEGDEATLLATFVETLQTVLAINTNPYNTWWAEVNEYATLNQDYYFAPSSSSVSTPPVPADGRRRRALLAPATVDWQADGKVAPVGNQNLGTCPGCSWAFAAATSLQFNELTATGQNTDLSEQQLVDCLRDSCWIDEASTERDCCVYPLQPDIITAYSYIKSKGLTTEANYPWQGGSAGTCDTAKLDGIPASDFVQIQSVPEILLPQTADQMMEAVALAPTVVGMFSSNQLLFYGGGIFNPDQANCPTPTEPPYAYLTTTGYNAGSGSGDALAFWRLQNSWGTDWGEDGSVRVAMYGDSNDGICGMYTQVVGATSVAQPGKCDGVVCDNPGTCETATGASCDEATGTCTYPADVDATCTTPNGSNQGRCGSDKSCIDRCEGISCNTPGFCETATGASCDSSTGTCVYNANIGGACLIPGGTEPGVCQSDKSCTSKCQGVSCDSPGPCEVAAGATCDAGSGVCSYPAAGAETRCTTPGGSTKGFCNPADRSCKDKCEGVPCENPGTCETAVGAECNSDNGVCKYPANTGAPCATAGGSVNGRCQEDKKCVDKCEGVQCITPGTCETATGAACDRNTGNCTYPANVGANCTTPTGSTRGLCQADRTCLDKCEGVVCNTPGQCETAVNATCDPAVGPPCQYLANPGAKCTTRDGFPEGRCQPNKDCIDLCAGVTCYTPDIRLCQIVPGSCDPDTGKCFYTAAPAGTPCNPPEGGICAVEQRCKDPCEGVVCNTPPPCYASPGTCSRGLCSYLPAAVGTACGAEGRCDNTTTCVVDRCLGKVCDEPGPCEGVGACDGATGECVYQPACDGTLCDGGACRNATCTDLCAGVTCNKPGTCQEKQGNCSALTGECEYKRLPTAKLVC